ncbi:MAG TPA: hypothetical protein VJ046_02685 [Candidatus Paceibacterota bacterium]|nr:hypothetical protein [Candidatus Paceibacterota bacterium]
MPDPKLQQLMLSWRMDSYKFAREACGLDGSTPGVDALSNQQIDGCKHISLLTTAKWKFALGQPMTDIEKIYAKKIGISIMSGQGTGKDFWTGLHMLWFLSCFEFPIIGATAPTQHQLKDVLWSQIYKIANRRKEDGSYYFVLRDMFEIQADKVFLKEYEGKQWCAVARTTNTKASADEQGETLAGLHEHNMLVVADEASKVPDAVFKPFEGGMTQECNIGIVIFNPTRSVGYAIQTQFKNRESWVCLRWNAEESDIVTKESIAEKAKKHGKDSNFFRIRVLGLPPTIGTDELIPWDWVMDAVDRDVQPMDDDPLIFIIDVGAGGDDTALCRRKGPQVLPFEVTNIGESEQLTNWLLRRILIEEPRFVFIDPIGVGWGIAGNLRSKVKNSITEIIEVNVAEAAAEDAKFLRLRDELGWKVREEFEARTISIPDDPLLIDELTTIRVDQDRLDGKIKLEGKRDLRKRMDSPNRFDTILMSEFYGKFYIRKMATRKKKKQEAQPSWRVT